MAIISTETTGPKPGPVPDLPPDIPRPPIQEPEPDTLPDEIPNPNPDENDEPGKIADVSKRLRASRRVLEGRRSADRVSTPFKSHTAR